MADRVGFGSGGTRRIAASEPSCYRAPPSLHAGAAWFAAGAPLLATLILFGARLG